MKQWTVWPWIGEVSDSDYNGSHSGALWRQLHDALNSSKSSIMSPDATSDLSDRIQHSCDVLGLPEPVQDLVDRFMAEQVVETWLDEKEKIKNPR
jgi:hypothetical protein